MDKFDERDKKLLQAIKEMVFDPLDKKIEYVSKQVKDIKDNCIQTINDKLETIDGRFKVMDSQFNTMNNRINSVESNISEINKSLKNNK